MNTKIICGKFYNGDKAYRSENGQHYFKFQFLNQRNYYIINCTEHPSFNGQSSSVEKTHLYSSGSICFVKGKEPRTIWEAESRAKEWAEYFLEYRKTGKAKS